MSIPFLLSVFDRIGYHTIRILLTVMWQSSIVLVVISLLTYMLRRKKESVRYYLWLTAILIMPLLPLLTWGISKTGTPQAEIHLIPAYSTPQALIEEVKSEPSALSQNNLGNDQNNGLQNIELITSEISNSDMEFNPGTRISIFDYPWAFAFILYFVIVAFHLIFIIIGRIKIRNWIVTCVPTTDPHVINVFQDVKERMAISKDILIIENKHLPAPMTCRIFNPVVVLPSGFTDRVSTAELRAVAIHEFSHIKHKDLFILSIVSVVRAVFFFHPLLWFAAHEISFLVESSCDNEVLNLTGDRLSYAKMLSRLAHNMHHRIIKTELAVGIIFSKSMFYRRINCIVSRSKEQIRNLSRLAVAITVAAVIVSLTTALLTPLAEKLNPDIASAKKTTGWMNGKIVDYDGNPVSGALLVLTHDAVDPSEAITDKDGKYSFENLTETIFYRITMSQKEYGTFYFNYIPSNQINNFRIKKADHFLSGKVVDANGNPIEGARIETDPIRIESEVVYCDERTDIDGNFRLNNIFTETVCVYVNHIQHGYKAFDSVETNRNDVIFTLDSPEESEDYFSSMAYQPSGSYNTIFVQGQAPVKIDGDLLDWAPINPGIERLVRNNPPLNELSRFSFISPVNEEDLSANVQCFADESYIYFAADVTDDVVFFDNLPFLSTLGVYDTFVIKIHGDKKESSVTYMWLTCDGQGEPFLEGRDPVTKEAYPYLMESLGVKSALKQTGDGYSVEIAIPWSVPEMGGLGLEDYLGITVWIYDRDRKDMPQARKMICWAVNGINDFIEINFSKSNPGIDGREEKSLYKSDSYDRIFSVLKSAQSEDWNTAEELLKSYDEEPWIKPALAMIQGKAGKKDEMVNTFIEVIENTPHIRAGLWAEDHVHSYARTLEKNGQHEEASVVLEKITGIDILEKIVDRDISYSAHYDSRLALGYNYFMSGNYASANKTIKVLLNSKELSSLSPDSYVVTQARQLLGSIDRAIRDSK
jgi:beta-lactamase regulating signal transducer with metallopeptidase domain